MEKKVEIVTYRMMCWKTKNICVSQRYFVNNFHMLRCPNNSWRHCVRGATMTINRHRFTGLHPSPSPFSPFTVTDFTGLHRAPSPISSVFTDHHLQSHRSLISSVFTSEHLTIRGEKLPLRYQLPGNRVTEVSAILFLTKNFQNSLFEEFESVIGFSKLLTWFSQ